MESCKPMEIHLENDAGAFTQGKIVVNSRHKGSCILENSFPKSQVNVIFRLLSDLIR